MVTLAVRRVNLTDKSRNRCWITLIAREFFILPNTAGCYTADEAVRTARLGCEVGLSEWVKLEVIGDQQTLFPDTEQLISATKTLVAEGFVVLPYTNRRFYCRAEIDRCRGGGGDAFGCADWFGDGDQNVANLRILRERITEVPLIVDAGVGTASDAALGDGIGGGWRFDEYRDCRGARFRFDGGGDGVGCGCGTEGVLGWAHREKTLCGGV